MPERVPVSIRTFTALIVLVCPWRLGEYGYLKIAVKVGNVKRCCRMAKEVYERIYVTAIEESGRSFERAAKAKLTALPKPHQRSVDRSVTKLIGSVDTSPTIIPITHLLTLQ